ncbi:hypothetical protein CVS40_8439 [Lucilia cuprina]|nr:hypothetical protein CVS40_8439 [Lucilia cuprina]
MNSNSYLYHLVFPPIPHHLKSLAVRGSCKNTFLTRSSRLFFKSSSLGLGIGPSYISRNFCSIGCISFKAVAKETLFRPVKLPTLPTGCT